MIRIGNTFINLNLVEWIQVAEGNKALIFRFGGGLDAKGELLFPVADAVDAMEQIRKRLESNKRDVVTIV